jgi:hypothetical protein
MGRILLAVRASCCRLQYKNSGGIANIYLDKVIFLWYTIYLIFDIIAK